MATTINQTDDLIDLRDVIARVEELREERDTLQTAVEEADEALDGSLESADAKHDAQTLVDEWALDNDEELEALESLLDDCKGKGGDEQWEGDWYPVTLIRESHFEDYAQQLAEDIGAIDDSATWPNNCIDWERAARELRMDYTEVEFKGVSFLTR
jgi:hypothetical protein